MDPSVSDSLQVSLDTLQVLEMQSDTMLVADADSTPLLKRPSFYVAVFTGVYMVVTGLIFWKTRKQAEAAQKSMEASWEAAKASQESNTIQKRANFYPTFDMELKSHGMKFTSLVPKVISVDDNAIVNAHLFVLVEYEKTVFNRVNFGHRVYAGEDKHALLWGKGLGNITSEETCRIKAKRQIKGAHFLLRFSDALMNTYYRYQHFQIEKRDKRVAQPYETITTEMDPVEEYTTHPGEKGIYFVPQSDIGGSDGSTIRTREEAKKGQPEPVRVFSEKVYWKAAGGLESLGRGLEARK